MTDHDLDRTSEYVRQRYDEVFGPDAYMMLARDLASALIALEKADEAVSAGYVRRKPRHEVMPPEPVHEPL